MSYFDDTESLEWHRHKWEKMHKRGAAFFVLLIGVPVLRLFTVYRHYLLGCPRQPRTNGCFCLRVLRFLLASGWALLGCSDIGMLAKSAICVRRNKKIQSVKISLDRPKEFEARQEWLYLKYQLRRPSARSVPHPTQNEALLFEKSSPGKRAYKLPPLDVPAVERTGAAWRCASRHAAACCPN